MTKRGLVKLIPVIVVLALCGLLILNRHTVRAQWKSLVVLSQIEQVPILTAVTGALTDAPSRSDLTVAGISTSRCQPAGNDVSTAIIVIGLGRSEQSTGEFGKACMALARAGMTVYAPMLSDRDSAGMSVATQQSLRGFVGGVTNDSSTRDGGVVLASAGPGASVALLIAADKEVSADVRMVIASSPFASVRSAVQLATTGTYDDGSSRQSPHMIDPWIRELTARSLVQVMRDGGVNPALTNSLDQQIQKSTDPFDPFRSIPDAFIPEEGKALVRVMANQDPARFAELWDALPNDLRARAEQLSPDSRAGEISASVELLEIQRGGSFPLAESERLGALLSQARISRIPQVDGMQSADYELTTSDARELNSILTRLIRDAHAPNGAPAP